ncbi:MAG TPA: sulfotransferase [Candidatus Polarisedimenticolia bacterium]|nr:sulfotransferase [Candidatus Polarisedimenticolia bacterium]
MASGALAEQSLLPRDLSPPIVVFCKSHSGSRLLVEMLQRAGIFMGAHCSGSGDSWDLAPLLRYLVIRHYPDYRAALAGGDELLAPMIAAAFARHLDGYDRKDAPPWGWKLCESAYAMPVISALFPQARYIHLLRDGRDVAFSNHTGPVDAYWRKIFFGHADIESWHGMSLNGSGYRRRPHLFNAQHWLSSVSLGHRTALELGARCLELRYEDLIQDPRASAARLFAFLGLGNREITPPPIHLSSAGRFRRQPLRKVREVLGLIAPLQQALGYPASET